MTRRGVIYSLSAIVVPA